jgi:hypothetical protein
MSSQLPIRMSRSRLRTMQPVTGTLGYVAPHLRYANLEFGRSDTLKKAKPLLMWIGFYRWDETRVLKYLEDHQEEFRRCLEWLSTGATTSFDDSEGEPEDEPGDIFGSNTSAFADVMRERWEQQPEVKFLEKHGLRDAHIALRPKNSDGPFFYKGIELDQRSPKDPLDQLCGFLISLLMWDGTVGVCRCANPECHQFFRLRTMRKIYCSNLCRATAHMNRKSPEARNEYMRKYRENKKKLERAKEKAARNVSRFHLRPGVKSRPRPL